jgi:hypothetical protein
MANTNSLEAATWLAALERDAATGQLPTAVANQLPTVDELETLIEARIRNAYEAALRKLARQHQGLLSIRSQAAGILTVGALITSLAVSLDFLKSDTSTELAFPTWAKWTLLGILLSMIGLHVVTSWPVERTFGADPESVIWTGENPPEGPIQKTLLQELIADSKENEKRLNLCARLYQAQSSALIAEAIIIVIAAIRR